MDAEELLADNIDGLRELIGDDELFTFYRAVVLQFGIEFAKIKTREALHVAGEKAIEIQRLDNRKYVSKKRLIASYPLKNIK